MAIGNPIGRRVRELRESQGLSALAVSKRAGVGVNYVRQLERGGRFPRPDKLMSIVRALDLSESEAAELRRLAGIDPDPGATPAAKAARREAWAPLTFILVNHVLLPRLRLVDVLDGKSRGIVHDRNLLIQAAEAADITTFAAQVAAESRPGPALRRLLEDSFGGAPPDVIQLVHRHVQNELFSRNPHGLGSPFAKPYRWDHRWAIARVLVGHYRPGFPEVQLYDFIQLAGFDYNFAACLFPAAFWHACRVWPFEKVVLPEGRPERNVQRRLYDAVRDGLSLKAFAANLVGQGDFGAELSRVAPVRQSPEDVEPNTSESVMLTLQRGGRIHELTGRRPPTDLIFDHLDRCTFLDRFPLIKLDRSGFAELARSLDLPSWTVWAEFVATHWRFPENQPPRSPERFESVIFDQKSRDATEDAPSTLDSYVLRRIVDEVGDGIARLLGVGNWSAALQVSKAAGIRPAWLQIVQALADRERAPGPAPTSKPA
jgi:transcriptional regulator with XRE-family HTH domain